MSFSLDRLLYKLSGLPPTSRYLIAFSGGMDSAVLLDAMAMIRVDLGAEIDVVHIDHGLHQDSSVWTEQCRRFCEHRELPFRSISLDLAIATGESIESAAREARYDALESCMETGDVLLTAHHQDDQAETFFLHLMRGSGMRGLASMPLVRAFGDGWLARPLLEFSRKQLSGYAQQRKLEWIDDPSNSVLDHDRNFLRHEVLSRLKRRWPASSKVVSASVGIIQEGELLLEERALELLREVMQPNGALSIAALKTREQGWQRLIVRQWLRERQLPLPPRRRLDELLRQLDGANLVVLWDGVQVRRYRDLIYAFSPFESHDNSLVMPLTDNHSLQLPGRLGLLSVRGDQHCEVRFRRGGEVLHWHGHERPLKDLFQQLGVPPWLRDRVPLVFRRDNILHAVADLLSADSSSLDVCWQRGEGWPIDDRMTNIKKLNC